MTSMLRSFTVAAALFGAALIPASASAANNGISSLIAVSQLKVKNANDEAVSTAEQQRDRVKKEKAARQAQQQAAQTKARTTVREAAQQDLSARCAKCNDD